MPFSVQNISGLASTDLETLKIGALADRPLVTALLQ